MGKEFLKCFVLNVVVSLPASGKDFPLSASVFSWVSECFHFLWILPYPQSVHLILVIVFKSWASCFHSLPSACGHRERQSEAGMAGP